MPCLLILLLVFLHCPIAYEDNPYKSVSTQILSLCGSCAVLILGERHQQPESLILFLDMAQQLIDRGEQILVGLEIPTVQQHALDTIIQKQEILPGLVPPFLDSPFYWGLLLALAELWQRASSRMAVVAIDGKTDRDNIMATQITSHLATGKFDRAIVLVGNYHALRKIQWAEQVMQQTPFMAEQLVSAGIQVTSVLQAMENSCEHHRQPLFSALTEQKGIDVANRLVSRLNIVPEMDVRTAIDGVVVWRCLE